MEPTEMTQSIGGIGDGSSAVGCNVNGHGITITDNRVFIVIQGTDSAEMIAEAVTAALVSLAAEGRLTETRKHRRWLFKQ